MTIKDVKEFLKSKPGYLGWGSMKLAALLEVDVKKCKKALREVRKEVSHPEEKQTEENLVLRSRWYNGKEWCESYRNVNLEEIQIGAEDWIDILKEAPKVKPVKVKVTKKTSNKSLIIWSSDKHIGAAIPCDALYKRKYDQHIFHQRMNMILEETLAYAKLHGKFDTLVIADLGDSLDGYNGFTTRGGHKLPQNLNNKDAARVHFFTHKWFYESLIAANIANKITILNVTNCNHSGDFGWQASFALQQYGTLAWPDVEFINQEEFLGHIVLYNRAYITTHGKDKKNRFKGLPLQFNPATESFIMDYVLDRGLGAHKIHVRKGDLHMNVHDAANLKMTYWNIGSVFGSSDWIMDNFSDGLPSCTFEIVEEGNNDSHGKVKWLS